MCIIAYKPAGLTPDLDILWNCFQANPDGAGLMYPNGGKVQIIKGFMGFESLEDYVLLHERLFISKAVAFHFRWATHGEIAPSHCHPFPIKGNLRATKVKTDMGLMHNGIIPIETQGDESDTMAFVRQLPPDVVPALVAAKQRFLTMTPSQVTLVGNFIHDGWYYSNDTYLPLLTYPNCQCGHAELEHYPWCCTECPCDAYVEECDVCGEPHDPYEECEE